MAPTWDDDEKVFSRMRSTATTEWARRCVQLVSDLRQQLVDLRASRDAAAGDGARLEAALADARAAVRGLEDDGLRLRAQVADLQAGIQRALSERDAEKMLRVAAEKVIAEMRAARRGEEFP